MLYLWPPASTEELSDEDEVHAMGNLEHNEQRDLFLASQIVKRAIEISPQLDIPTLFWPPTLQRTLQKK